jgi:phage regulator Rha-like protein
MKKRENKTSITKEAVTLAQVEERLVTIRNQSVLLDRDVAALYAVETREVNQAIKNNPEKFPEGYIVQLNKEESDYSRSKILTLKKTGQGHNLKYPPKAFTEKGLYMLATILKGEQAVRTTLAIVETFAKIRELARTVSQLADTSEKFKQQSLMQKSGEIMADILGDGMKATDTETSVEINLAVLKFKHIVRRKTET